MKQKHFGIIGISIPFLFLIGMLIYYALFNSKAILQINNDPLILYTIKELNGSEWMAYFNQIFIGILMVTFIAFLLNKTDNSITNLIGKIFLMISSLAWAASGLIPAITNNNNDYIELVIILTGLVIGCGAIGFITISSELEKIYTDKLLKKLILFTGILIGVEAIFNFIFINNYPTIISKITWFAYFGGFGLIGYSILKKSLLTTGVKHNR